MFSIRLIQKFRPRPPSELAAPPEAASPITLWWAHYGWSLCAGGEPLLADEPSTPSRLGASATLMTKAGS